jgi:hypothetical protein
MIRVATPSPFLAGELFELAEPAAFAVLESLWLEFGEAHFSIRPEIFHELDWLDDHRILAAMRMLFFHEILAEVPETFH